MAPAPRYAVVPPPHHKADCSCRPDRRPRSRKGKSGIRQPVGAVPVPTRPADGRTSRAAKAQLHPSGNTAQPDAFPLRPGLPAPCPVPWYGNRQYRRSPDSASRSHRNRLYSASRRSRCCSCRIAAAWKPVFYLLHPSVHGPIHPAGPDLPCPGQWEETRYSKHCGGLPEAAARTVLYALPGRWDIPYRWAEAVRCHPAAR